MQHLYRLPLSAVVLAITLAVSVPAPAGAKSEGHGKPGRGHSSEARGGHSGKREYRANVRWCDSGRRSYAPSYRSRTHYRGDLPSYSHYRQPSYYTGSFHRPQFVYRSGFSLGFVIGSVPSYGYRYFDPYCDMGFSNLGVYYDHCNAYGHADVIQVLDIRSGYPIASCAYRGGYWVVDDCH